jgi:hypothetical protein
MKWTLPRVQRMSHTKLTVNLHEILSFFDESAATAAHANAIKAVAGEELGFALLLEYFRRRGIAARMGAQRCTTGNARGERLDGWIVVPNGDCDTYYQVEVKAWSRHSLGGRPLAVTVTPDQLSEFKKERWRRYWVNDTFVDKQLAKVLTPMRPPIPGVTIEPLACLWDAVHPFGLSEPFFKVDLAEGNLFRRFSMSGFLRGLSESTLKLELPCIEERLNWLSRLFPKIHG